VCSLGKSCGIVAMRNSNTRPVDTSFYVPDITSNCLLVTGAPVLDTHLADGRVAAQDAT
jgi:hypothetical protein